MQDNNTEHKHMFKGSWKCSMCGAEINELPFQPEASGKAPVCEKCEAMKRQKEAEGK